MSYSILKTEKPVQVLKTAIVQQDAKTTRTGIWQAKIIALNEWDIANGATFRIVSGSSDYKYIQLEDETIQQNHKWHETIIKRVKGTKHVYCFMDENENWNEKETVYIKDIKDVEFERWFVGYVKKD